MDLKHLTLAEIPEDGLHLEGQLDGSLFDIDPGDAQPTGPLEYQLDLLPSGEVLLVTGSVRACFRRECVRCLEPFEEVISLDPYAADVETEGKGTIDLTERLREDILLALPAYPHCDSTGDGRECPASHRFLAPDPGDEPADESGSPPGAWDALGDWNPRPPKDSSST